MDNTNLIEPKEGFLRGNLFNNLYDPYKNYMPVTLKGRTDEERMYLELARICFAKHEINLYLDLHPEDTSMIRLFNDYREKEMMLLKQYEEKYGPINTDSSVLEKTPFMWVKDGWPWEVNRYV